ncbi:MAG: nucleoside transporter [Desulfobacteraceae bacterium]|nr:nucleoside transporter [Desulfobacteraceae bacterium]
MDIYNLISFAGIFGLLGIAWFISRFIFKNTQKINWHLLGWALGLQLLFAVFLFVLPVGVTIFQKINDLAVLVLGVASAGAQFVFGPLAIPPGVQGSLGFILAFQAFPTIIFFSALVSVLYYYGVLPFIIRQFARLFTGLMRISGAEALCTASNIFVGIESIFTIKPHIDKMTRSELCTILTAGMATVASSVLALYVFTLQNIFPSIAGHLISASFLSAPAALVMSKLIFPETGIPKTLGKVVDSHYERDSNLFEAIINGATSGLKVVFSIVALLIAVIGLVALVDLILGGVGGMVNHWIGTTMDWSLTHLLGYIFYPFTLIIGVPAVDAGIISRIIGERIILTEVASYQDLALALSHHSLVHPRSAVVAAYALCGFAHVASMAIFVGGITALAPKRTIAISKVAVKALIAATFACLLTACVAGTFYSSNSLLLGN